LVSLPPNFDWLVKINQRLQQSKATEGSIANIKSNILQAAAAPMGKRRKQAAAPAAPTTASVAAS
jgi:hypothetical protein